MLNRRGGFCTLLWFDFEFEFYFRLGLDLVGEEGEGTNTFVGR
jgi:hypothetical protein